MDPTARSIRACTVERVRVVSSHQRSLSESTMLSPRPLSSLVVRADLPRHRRGPAVGHGQVERHAVLGVVLGVPGDLNRAVVER